MTCINMYEYKSVLSLSQTQESAPVETQERPFPYRQQQQASIKQQLVNVYVSFLTSISPVMVTDWLWLMLLSVLRSFLIKGVSGCDSVFKGISVTQPIGVTIFCVLDSIRDKCSFSTSR